MEILHKLQLIDYSNSPSEEILPNGEPLLDLPEVGVDGGGVLGEQLGVELVLDRVDVDDSLGELPGLDHGGFLRHLDVFIVGVIQLNLGHHLLDLADNLLLDPSLLQVLVLGGASSRLLVADLPQGRPSLGHGGVLDTNPFSLKFDQM